MRSIMPRYAATLLTTLTLCGLLSLQAHAWTDPVLVTPPDSSMHLYPELVFDNDGNMHYFFVGDKDQIPWGHDIYYCKLLRDGTRVTTDIRLDTTYSAENMAPSALLGEEGKLHVIWNDYIWQPGDSSAIYYCRLDVNGNIEIPAKSIFYTRAKEPLLFQDSWGNLNAVWLVENDTLFYGKFDTTGQVIISKTVVYQPGSIGISNLEACMDGLDQIHCTYRHYWGVWTEYNLGYSRINSDGQVLIDYAPLTPQTGDSSCGGADIIADDSNDLYISYMLRLSNVFYQRVRKFNQNLDTIWDYTMVDNQLAGALIGNGDIGQDYLGNIVCVFVNNGIGLDAQRMRATYSTNGEELIPAETIIEEEVLFGDLALRADGVAVFSFTWSEDSYDPGNEVYYCWVEDELSVVSEVSEVLPRELSISVYPNPVNSRANISIINPQGGDVHVQLIDPLGRIVHDYGEFFLQGRKELLLGKGLSSGVYYLSVSSGSGTTPTTEIFKPIVMLK